jgi:hypothetical protein
MAAAGAQTRRLVAEIRDLPRSNQALTQARPGREHRVAPFLHSGLRALLLAAASILFAGTGALAQGRIEILARPITFFDNRDHELRRFGKVEFRGGLELTSPTREFGELSGLRMEPDGSRFLAVTDGGRWVRGRVVYSGAAPSAIADAEMAPMLGADGKRLTTRGWYDTESVAEDAGSVYVGVERVHGILKFDFAKGGLQARGVPVPVPPEFKSFPSNKSIEALAVAPKGHPLAGTLIVITEAALDASGNNRAFLLGGPTPGAFSVKRIEDFDVTDCALLPGGDLLILERRLSLLSTAVRLRRIASGDLRPGATVEGSVLLYATFGQQIDNFEGLGVHRTASGETVLTLVSDNNFSPLQRTLLMQFTLLE